MRNLCNRYAEARLGAAAAAAAAEVGLCTLNSFDP
jgi:hypothetical protein